MSPFFTRTGYVAAVLMLLSAGLMALSIFGSSGHKAERMAAEPQADTRPSSTAFRYGPDVNHGRSDTPLGGGHPRHRSASPAGTRSHNS